jgi:hypothetical protein
MLLYLFILDDKRKYSPGQSEWAGPARLNLSSIDSRKNRAGNFLGNQGILLAIPEIRTRLVILRSFIGLKE